MSAATQSPPIWHADDDELPVNPFEALRVSFGMLLGEPDFRTLMGNPRGKQMLHSSWLHGSGVVWGYQVDRADDGQLRIGAGLAIDGLGRELVLHAPKCIDIDRWAAERLRKGSSDPLNPCVPLPVTTACLVASFDLCPTRPVPALADPCDAQRTHEEPSRLIEQVHLELVEGDCSTPPQTGPYHRVRVLLGLDEVGAPDPAGKQAAGALAEVLQQPPAKRAGSLLTAFRRMLALDVTEIAPPDKQLFPLPEDKAAVTLARIVIGGDRKGTYAGRETWEADITVRQGLVATSTIQELTCGMAPGVLGARAGQDKGGPRVVRDSISWEKDDSTLVFKVTKPLMRGSLSRDPVSVSSLGSDGWDREDIDDLQYDGDANTVRVRLYRRPTHPLVRLIVRGTGKTPVTGTTGIPLAGLDDGEAGTRDDGHDAVLRIDRSST